MTSAFSWLPGNLCRRETAACGTRALDILLEQLDYQLLDLDDEDGGQ
jgi:hypothetical protein